MSPIDFYFNNISEYRDPFKKENGHYLILHKTTEFKQGCLTRLHFYPYMGIMGYYPYSEYGLSRTEVKYLLTQEQLEFIKLKFDISNEYSHY